MRDSGKRLLAPAAVLALALGMLRWTWLAWPDALIDFGREAYVPWQLSQGQVLYADIAYFNGPLSPYLNAALFRAFGVSLATLFAANAAIAAGVAVLLWRIFGALADRRGASLASGLFVLLFACAQYVGIGNYNFIAPYSHEATHGLALALVGLVGLEAFARSRRAGWVAVMGLSVGLAFLTKIEMFLAAAAGSGGGLALWLAVEHPGRARALRLGALFAAASLLPPVAAWAALALLMPADQAFRGVLGGWTALVGGGVASLDFYQRGLGTDDIAGNSLRMVGWFGAGLLVLAPALILAFWRGLPRRSLRLARALAFALTAAALLWIPSAGHWINAARALPLVILCLAAISGARLLRGRGRPASAREIARLGLLLLSGVLLAKMVLHARMAQYGFVLALPAVLTLAVALASGVPCWIDRHGGTGAIFRAAALGAITVAVLVHVGFMQPRLAVKNHIVGVGLDRIRVDALRGPPIERALREIEARLESGGTLLVLPEGVTLNFLARRASPTRFINFMPPEVAIFGEARMLQSLRSKPPDLVLLVHKDTSEYGFPYFGRDYGRELMEWVRRHYRPVRRFGKPPFDPDTRFGILVLEPVPAASPRERPGGSD